MDQSTNLPDNLKSRVARIHVAKRTFTDNDGKNVDYQRLILGGLVNGTPVDIEVKVDKKDLTLLSVFDVVDQPQLGE